ncbi:MAG TPA: hypothetical protein VNN79_00225 [Actinomycetota bacterium]|nr:hypothetical protein [Actinomycetota bacterium]
MAQRERPPVGARPGVVTVAALVLAAAGAAALLDCFILLFVTSVGAVLDVVVVLLLAVGALEVFAATQVFELRERGRRLGITMAVLSAVFSLVLIAKGTVLSVIGLAADAFVIYALYANREYFAG